ERVLPPVGTDAIFAYCLGNGPGELYARMFAPLDATVEDPATGSAAAATIAHLTAALPDSDAECSWHIEQGTDMGRPSTLRGRTLKRAGQVIDVRLSGEVVRVMRGTIQLS